MLQRDTAYIPTFLRNLAGQIEANQPEVDLQLDAGVAVVGGDREAISVAYDGTMVISLVLTNFNLRERA